MPKLLYIFPKTLPKMVGEKPPNQTLGARLFASLSTLHMHAVLGAQEIYP